MSKRPNKLWDSCSEWNIGKELRRDQNTEGVVDICIPQTVLVALIPLGSSQEHTTENAVKHVCCVAHHFSIHTNKKPRPLSYWVIQGEPAGCNRLRFRLDIDMHLFWRSFTWFEPCNAPNYSLPSCGMYNLFSTHLSVISDISYP